MTVFDWEVWQAHTHCMPKEKISDGLVEMLRRKHQADDEPARIVQRNVTAKTFHASQTPDLVDGVPVWVPPIGDSAGYSAGARTHHQGEVWVNPGPDIAMEEPGVGDEWMLEIQESPARIEGEVTDDE